MTALLKIDEITNDGLVREYNVVVPQSRFEGAVEDELKKIAKTIKMDGFRPGKVPLHLVRQRYGQSVANDALESLINNTVQETLSGRSLKIAGQPKLTFKAMKPEADLEYSLKVELLPDIPPLDASAMEIERANIEITETDVEKAIQKEIDEFADYVETDADYTATTEDRLEITQTMVLTDTGEALEENETRYVFPADADQHLPEYLSAFIGLKRGDTKTFEVTFPDDGTYKKEVAGKKATYTVEVLEVMKGKRASTLEEMLELIYGMEMRGYNAKASTESAEQDTPPVKQAVEEYRAGIRTELEEANKRETDSLSRLRLLDALNTQFQFLLPPTLVEEERHHLLHRLEPDAAKTEDGKECHAHSDSIKEKATTLAERRVKLGLILAEYGRIHQIQVLDEDVRMEIHRTAFRSGRYREVLDFFSKNPQAIDSIRASLFEQAVIDKLLTQVRFKETTVSRAEFDIIMKAYADDQDQDTDE